MKRILEFNVFESLNGLSEYQKSWLDECTDGSWSVGPDGKVDVQGHFDCSSQNLERFKGVKFGRVSGDFWCYDNGLETLEGAPESVGEDFYCYNNGLETLEGAPETVGGRFFCGDNRLTTLEGAPKVVGGDFWCNDNRLTSLEGAPEKVGGGFYSDSIEIPKGQWGLSGWIKMLDEGKPEAQKLISTLISPEALNKRLEESPERTMVALKAVWNSSEFAKIRSQLRIPKGYEDEMDLLGDLDDIGL